MYTPDLRTKWLDWKKSICCTGGLCGAVVLKFWRSGQCCKIFPKVLHCIQGRNVTCIKLICKSLIYAEGALNFFSNPQITLEFLMKLCFFHSGEVAQILPNSKFFCFYGVLWLGGHTTDNSSCLTQKFVPTPQPVYSISALLVWLVLRHCVNLMSDGMTKSWWHEWGLWWHSRAFSGMAIGGAFGCMLGYLEASGLWGHLLVLCVPLVMSVLGAYWWHEGTLLSFDGLWQVTMSISYIGSCLGWRFVDMLGHWQIWWGFVAVTSSNKMWLSSAIAFSSGPLLCLSWTFMSTYCGWYSV